MGSVTNPINPLLNAASNAYVDACQLEAFGLVTEAAVNTLRDAYAAVQDLHRLFDRELTVRPWDRPAVVGSLNVFPFPLGGSGPRGGNAA